MVNAGVTLKVGPGHGTPTTVTTRTGQKVDVMDILAKQTEILEKLAGNAKLSPLRRAATFSLTYPRITGPMPMWTNSTAPAVWQVSRNRGN